MKKILLLLLCFITTYPSFCQVDDKKENELLIVALDVRSRVKTYWSASSISNCISGILAKNNIKPDNVSGVLYGIEEGAPTPTGFSKLKVEPEPIKNSYVGLLETLHSQIPYGTFYSITSFAKPYSLMALKGKQNTNRTFMVIITDGVYNVKPHMLRIDLLKKGKISSKKKLNQFKLIISANLLNNNPSMEDTYNFMSLFPCSNTSH